MPKKSKIGKIASSKTKAEFAEQLSSYTTLTADEIKLLFPKSSDRKELIELIQIVHSDTETKEKQAKLVANIGKVSGAVIKLAKKIIV